MKKHLVGEVVSDKMAKTVVVKITVIKKHPKYHKQYTRNLRYKAHDENREYRMGDIVEIEETRPLSKDKNWIVIRKVK